VDSESAASSGLEEDGGSLGGSWADITRRALLGNDCVSRRFGARWWRGVIPTQVWTAVS
jgi:hypothetical protein